VSEYNREQLEALVAVRRHIEVFSVDELAHLQSLSSPYLSFRRRVSAFLDAQFSEICSRSCFESRLSACCSREGIITFFADVVINLLATEPEQIERLQDALIRPSGGFKCVYLSENGCLWRTKPIVCEMFLCDRAQAQVFGQSPDLRRQWEALRREKKLFTWPNRPGVLFDEIEAIFLSVDCRSPLMYLHNSPGLLRVKKLAGVETASSGADRRDGVSLPTA
jgi:hypothetical protein